MKSPTNYGSENEEAHFIRRVAAPDRPNNKRRQKKRLAIAGATLGLLAASAGVGYTAMKNAGSTSAVKTANLKADMSNEAKAFISKLGDAFHPDFERIDQDHDGKLSKKEVIADLTQKEMVDVDRVKASDLPEDIKKNVVALLEGKLKSDSDCTRQALDQRQAAVTRADHEIFYYLLDVFCPRVTIAVTPPDQEEEEIPTENQQTVEIPTPDGGTTEVIIVGEPEDGKQTIAIPDEEGGYTTTEVRSIETPTGEQKILIPNAEGDITPVVVPEMPTEVTESTENTQVVDVVTSTGETEQVIIVGEPENGKQTVQIPDNEGGYTEKEAKVVETSEGEQLMVETTDGDIIRTKIELPEVDTPVIVPEVPAEVVREAEKTGETAQVVDVVTPTGETEQVIIEGEPEHGKQTVEIVDQYGQTTTTEYGQTTTTEVRVEETASGEQKLEIPTDGGYVAVDVPMTIDQMVRGEELNPYMPEEPAPVIQTVDVVADNGEHEQVILVGEVEDGKQTVKILNDEGGYTTKEVKAVETDEGEKLVIPDGEGGTTVVEVPEVPAEVANTATDDTQVVNVVTPEGNQVQVVVEGEPEHGEQTVQIIDEHGDVTTEQVKVVETSEGDKLEIKTDEGYVAVEVPEVPEEVKQEIAEEQPSEPHQESKYMTKDEFRDWISKHYEDKLSLLKEEEQKLEEEARAKLGRVKGLQDCIVQAANKFGYYGVYEQPPHFQNAVDWIQNDCWVQDRWEPESPPEHPMLRR
ncbi:hypothetical protein PPTG_22853 [Phytophthora nicotianae INRA-310]|uniref:EF-hand domain-containing protein n=1 Tax=Phytophthora nicotianae (strain INRA-310) TaxID=761204 RepID=W2Q9Q8_PHYN3|nr:hypothetical protein PPTG_22853 [Phytophthora nicotianae INRA-310]ETN09892.1 hypothetical protein PPTG_22853 [Phytophthora nicotianae INRA-310]